MDRSFDHIAIKANPVIVWTITLVTFLEDRNDD